MTRSPWRWIGGILAIIGSVVFVGPFAFVLLQATKTDAQARELDFALPAPFHLWENLVAVLSTQDFLLPRAFLVSSVLTIGSVVGIVICGALVGFILARRVSRLNRGINALVLLGLMVPPAVVPTIYFMQGMGIYKTLHGLILVEIAVGLPFAILLFRAFVASVPREIDEAAILDGAGPLRMFFTVVLPLLRPVLVTVVLVTGLAVYNDFVLPLYFLPGSDWPTVQLALFGFQDAEAGSQYSLIFMGIVLVALPPVVLFIFFNRQIVEGMAAGAVK